MGAGVYAPKLGRMEVFAAQEDLRSILSAGAHGREGIVCSYSEEIIGAALTHITTSRKFKGFKARSGLLTSL